MPETITHVGKFWTRDGQQQPRANVIGMGEAPIFIHRKDQSIIDQFHAIKDAERRAAADEDARIPDNYYHS